MAVGDNRGVLQQSRHTKRPKQRVSAGVVRC